MSDIGVCVSMFMRSSKLKTLLTSADHAGVEKVYVADDGRMTEEKESIYSADREFDLEVFELEFDAGLGSKRKLLASEAEEPYLLFMDSDMEVPTNYEILYEQLEARPQFGGVTPVYLEDGRISSVSTELYEAGERLYRDIRKPKKIEKVADAPFVEFDFLPNAGMFRKSCLEDYCWDEEYVIFRDHLDFYVGHWKQTDWRFALCPQVLMLHRPGGNDEYVTHRQSEEKYKRSEEYFRNKWNYQEVKIATDRWIDTYDPTLEGFPPAGPLKCVRERYKNEGVVAAARYAGGYVLSKR